MYNVGLLAICSTREVVSAALSFIKVYIQSFPREKIAGFVPSLVSKLLLIPFYFSFFFIFTLFQDLYEHSLSNFCSIQPGIVPITLKLV